MTLTEEIGAKIKYYRKKRGMKIVELAALLHKTGATVSKYESGQIAMDVVTLYEVAAALGVPPEKLLYCVPLPVEDLMADSVPAFFRGVDRTISTAGTTVWSAASSISGPRLAPTPMTWRCT